MLLGPAQARLAGEEELFLYPTVDGLAAATSGSREAVLLLSGETVEKIHQAASDLRQAEPLSDEGEAEDAVEADPSSGSQEP